MNRRSVTVFVVAGLAVALFLAFLISPLASSEPDGLERVAIDQGFAGNATGHSLAGGPLADYSVSGVNTGWLATGLSGVIGVALCFLLAAGLLLAIRWTSRHSSSSASRPGADPSASTRPEG